MYPRNSCAPPDMGTARPLVSLPPSFAGFEGVARAGRPGCLLLDAQCQTLDARSARGLRRGGSGPRLGIRDRHLRLWRRDQSTREKADVGSPFVLLSPGHEGADILHYVEAEVGGVAVASLVSFSLVMCRHP